MDRVLGVDPAHVRVGISLGAGEHGVGLTSVVTAVNEFLARMLNLSRLLVVVVPLAHQSCYLHSVGFGTWLARLAGIGTCASVICCLLAPEQFFNGMALRQWRWVFELVFPEASRWSGAVLPARASAEEAAGRPASLLKRSAAAELDGARIRLRWHGSGKVLGLTQEGWAAVGDDTFATTLVLEQVRGKGDEKVPDTYTLRVDDPTSRWDGAWLSFSSVNQLRGGGWLGTYRDAGSACPYKVLVDSSCPPGTCKLLSSWPHVSPVTLRYCTGYYLAEQLHGSRSFAGHAPDCDAALVELAAAPGAPVACS